MLPPTRAALLTYIFRANYVTVRDISYLTDCPELPSIEETVFTEPEYSQYTL